jgi:hypothetical protein
MHILELGESDVDVIGSVLVCAVDPKEFLSMGIEKGSTEGPNDMNNEERSK